MEIDIDLIEKDTQENINKLLDRLQNTLDVKEANKIGFLLIDNFKDERIESVLLSIIKENRFTNYNGTLFYLYSEVFTQVENLRFVVKTYIDNEKDGEIDMACSAIIIDTPPPIELRIINSILKYLRGRKKNKKISIKQLDKIDRLIEFYLVQRDLVYFYNEYSL